MTMEQPFLIGSFQGKTLVGKWECPDDGEWSGGISPRVCRPVMPGCNNHHLPGSGWPKQGPLSHSFRPVVSLIRERRQLFQSVDSAPLRVGTSPVPALLIGPASMSRSVYSVSAMRCWAFMRSFVLLEHRDLKRILGP